MKRKIKKRSINNYVAKHNKHKSKTFLDKKKESKKNPKQGALNDEL